MENQEKEVLNRYKLWQNLFEHKNKDVKDSNEDYLLRNCSSCEGCGCYADDSMVD